MLYFCKSCRMPIIMCGAYTSMTKDNIKLRYHNSCYNKIIIA